MKNRILPTSALLSVALALIASWGRLQAADAPNRARPAIYDESADGLKQIAGALETASKEHKHVLLQFGANWCKAITMTRQRSLPF